MGSQIWLPIFHGDWGTFAKDLAPWADVKAPAIELSGRGLVLEEYNPLSDNLNPGALTQPKGPNLLQTLPSLYGL